jgi:hypothetical protein
MEQNPSQGRPPGTARRRAHARVVTRAVIIVAAATIVWLVPEERQQHAVRDFTQSAVHSLDRLAFASVARYLREGLNDCHYDWRLRCIPNLRGLVTRTPLPPPRPITPLMRKLFTQEAPTAEDHRESERMTREYEVRLRDYEVRRADWQRSREEAQAYEASSWKDLRPILVGPGAVAHAVRHTFAANGIGGVVGIALSLALGALLVQLVPLGPLGILLIPFAASLVAGVLGFGMALVAKPLGWQGQSVTLLMILWESGKKIWDTFEWAEHLGRVVRFLQQRPIPHDVP